jgi:Flp pilus assembly protein TadG
MECPSIERSGQPGPAKQSQRRAGRRKGSEIIEFTLCLLPLLMMLTTLLDIAWAVYAQATIQRAVRQACRTGIILTNSQMAQGATLTSTVKGVVQQYAFGFLNGTTGLAYIKVNYFQPPAPSSSAAATDVSTQTNGNAPGNIMQVSVQSFPVKPLLPQIFAWKDIEFNLQHVSAYSADVIEPSSNPPPIGTAP